jgi:predicted Zn finger-like uncharacterized protein
MILECSECHTRYLVPDNAIGADGRTVRCAKCKHSWFQAPAALDLPAAAMLAPEPAPPPPAPEPQVAPPASPAAMSDPAIDQDFDAFAHEPPFRPRRNPARLWTIAAVVAGMAMLAAAAALLFFNVPGIATWLGLPGAGGQTPLTFVNVRPPDRRDLPSGSELFAVGGQIHNPSAQRQPIPDIRVELYDAPKGGRMVYSWVIKPDQPTIAPGGTIDFYSGKLDVPANSKNMRLSFSAGASGN